MNLCLYPISKQWFRKEAEVIGSQHTKMVCIAVPVHTHKYTILGTDAECIWMFFFEVKQKSME